MIACMGFHPIFSSLLQPMSVCEIVSKDYLAKGVEKVLGEKKKSLLPLNEQALSAGADSLCVSQ